MSYGLHVSVDRLILVPTTLGILVYVIASFACVKLLWHDGIGRWSALTAAVSILAIAPFAAEFLLAPALVALAALLYLMYISRIENLPAREHSADKQSVNKHSANGHSP